MADFNVNLTPSQGAGPRPIAPVQEQQVAPSPNRLLNEVVNIFSKGLVDDRKQRAEDFKNSVVSEYTNNEKVYMDALTTGQWTSSQAASASRANFSKMYAAYPQFQQEIAQSRKGLYEGAEIGKALSEEQMLAKRRQDDVDQASKLGFSFYDGISKEAENALINASKTEIRTNQDIEASYKRNAEDRAQASAGYAANAEQRAQYDAKVKVQDRVDKDNTVKGLLTIADKNFDGLGAVFKDLVNNPNMPQEQKQLLFGENTRRVRTGLLSIAASNPELAAPWIRLLDDQEGLFSKLSDPKIKGTEEKDKLQLQYDTIMLKQKLMIVADPKARAAVSLSNLFGNNSQILLSTEPVVTGMLAQLGLGPSMGEQPAVVGTPNEKQALQGMKAALQQVQKNSDPKAATEASNAMNAIIKQTGMMQKGVEGKQLKELASFYSSPEFGKWVEAGSADKESVENAKRVFQVSWEPSVVQAIQSRLSKNESDGWVSYSPGRDGGAARTRKDVPLINTINIKFTGSGVTFENKGKVDDTFSSASTRQALKESEAALNQLIKVGAHMEGSTNYAKYWEANKHFYLPEVFPDPTKLKVGQTITAKNGKKYKYTGGDYNDIAGSYMEIPDNAKSSE